MWFKIKDQIVDLHILVKPNAKKTALVAITDQELHISLHAKPQEGEANKELISYLAKLLRLPKSQIILRKGKKSRHKQISVPLKPIVQKLLDDPLSLASIFIGGKSK